MDAEIFGDLRTSLLKLADNERFGVLEGVHGCFSSYAREVVKERVKRLSTFQIVK
jgi:hypothetical protein